MRDSLPAAASALAVEIAGRRWHVAAQGYDISIPLRFDGAQPTFFGAPPATATAITAGTFVGDVRHGGSCNCSIHTLAPHCNGTHTECVGHITRERLSVRDLALWHLSAALLISVTPERSAEIPGDHVISLAALRAAIGTATLAEYQALVVRTLPNDSSKLTRNYDEGAPPAYFSTDAMSYVVEQGIDTLVVDMPSVDRAQDGGKLAAHRIFWGMPPASTSAETVARKHATITEMAYIDNSVPDGAYLLNLQVAPFMIDAAPSRPILLPLSPA
ncbi:cyclase family protein [Steroidobacter sp. S1-65]|uniref:Cyclase family protein n=1 Tax=Steroidobacter gossypii TaxID=2805490 RepID=A0ABS1X5F6_9GAMM|nr:cyclase family protein [Steroidobacter gossypii]MBM0108461.1 cyclase family protein [Steroidobacter gossypii]